LRNARGAVPDLEPPAADPADFGPHPDYGYPTSRTQLLLVPTTTATVGEVNAALASVGAVIISGSPLLGTFGVAIADVGDHSALLAALDTLRADPAFEDRTIAIRHRQRGSPWS
jgi:hypothetical protein